MEKLVDQNFSWAERVPQFLKYRYLRLAQTPNSIPAKIDAGLSDAARTIAEGLFALTFLPEALLKLSARGMIGASRLFVLQKCDG